MTLAESLNDRTIAQYFGGRLLFRNRTADLELTGRIARIVAAGSGVKVILTPESGMIKLDGRKRPATGNELELPVHDIECLEVDEIPHGVEIEWKGLDLYAKLERPLS